MTHEDARINAQLAKASRDFAEAAHRDSSSMKTIAIMTMAFLPATSFAALFSLPSFSKSAHAELWVYWALTIPTTIMVFLVWIELNFNKPTMRMLMQLRNVAIKRRERMDEEKSAEDK